MPTNKPSTRPCALGPAQPPAGTDSPSRTTIGGVTLARLETDTFNTQSQGFYLALGYREADRYPDLEWHSGFTTILYVKPLSS